MFHELITKDKLLISFNYDNFLQIFVAFLQPCGGSRVAEQCFKAKNRVPHSRREIRFTYSALKICNSFRSSSSDFPSFLRVLFRRLQLHHDSCPPGYPSTISSPYTNTHTPALPLTPELQPPTSLQSSLTSVPKTNYCAEIELTFSFYLHFDTSS